MELMSPIDALFLSAESREHPLHVGALQLFEPPAGAGRGFVRETYQAMLQCREIAPLFRKRPTSLHGALINLGWSTDADVDLGYHARRSALPAPGRVRELLELTSRLHSNLLDRHRPLWETHVIEGLRDGRFAIYSKMHHALVDGVSGLTLMRQPMTTDPIEGKLRTAWSPATQHTAIKRRRGRLQQLGGMLGSVAGLAPSTLRLARSALIEQQLTLPFGALAPNRRSRSTPETAPTAPIAVLRTAVSVVPLKTGPTPARPNASPTTRTAWFGALGPTATLRCTGRERVHEQPPGQHIRIYDHMFIYFFGDRLPNHGARGRRQESSVSAVGFPGRRAGRVHTAGVGDSEPADDPHPATERPASGNRPRRGYWNGTVRRLASTSSVAESRLGRGRPGRP